MAIEADRIIIAFFAAMAIIFLSSQVIGAERKSKWFRKRRKYGLFTRRGLLGESCHFGVPCTKEGVLTTILMMTLILSSSYIIVFKVVL